MATLTVAPDSCNGLFCRAFPGHAADPRHQLYPAHAIAAVFLTNEPQRFTRGAEIAIVFRGTAPEARPSWPAELTASMVKDNSCPFEMLLARSAWNRRLRDGRTPRSPAGGRFKGARQRAVAVALQGGET